MLTYNETDRNTIRRSTFFIFFKKFKFIFDETTLQELDQKRKKNTTSRETYLSPPMYTFLYQNNKIHGLIQIRTSFLSYHYYI